LTFMNDNDQRRENDSGELQERVVHIRRVAKVVKGGRHLTFNAMVVVGDGKGRVGAGLGKGTAVPDAVRKGTVIAKKNLMTVPIKGSTIPHAVRCNFGASVVLLKPAPSGAGVIAGGAVRAVMEAAGVKDVVAKALGSRNPINVVKATLAGFESINTTLGRRQGMGSFITPDRVDDGESATTSSTVAAAPREAVSESSVSTSIVSHDSRSSLSEAETTDVNPATETGDSDGLEEGSDGEIND
jgi:small subunit ribosomal protein S5